MLLRFFPAFTYAHAFATARLFLWLRFTQLHCASTRFCARGTALPVYLLYTVAVTRTGYGWLPVPRLQLVVDSLYTITAHVCRLRLPIPFAVACTQLVYGYYTHTRFYTTHVPLYTYYGLLVTHLLYYLPLPFARSHVRCVLVCCTCPRYRAVLRLYAFTTLLYGYARCGYLVTAYTPHFCHVRSTFRYYTTCHVTLVRIHTVITVLHCYYTVVLVWLRWFIVRGYAGLRSVVHIPRTPHTLRLPTGSLLRSYVTTRLRFWFTVRCAPDHLHHTTACRLPHTRSACRLFHLYCRSCWFTLLLPRTTGYTRFVPLLRMRSHTRSARAHTQLPRLCLHRLRTLPGYGSATVVPWFRSGYLHGLLVTFGLRHTGLHAVLRYTVGCTVTAATFTAVAVYRVTLRTFLPLHVYVLYRCIYTHLHDVYVTTWLRAFTAVLPRLLPFTHVLPGSLPPDYGYTFCPHLWLGYAQLPTVLTPPPVWVVTVYFHIPRVPCVTYIPVAGWLPRTLRLVGYRLRVHTATRCLYAFTHTDLLVTVCYSLPPRFAILVTTRGCGWVLAFTFAHVAFGSPPHRLLPPLPVYRYRFHTHRVHGYRLLHTHSTATTCVLLFPVLYTTGYRLPLPYTFYRTRFTVIYYVTVRLPVTFGWLLVTFCCVYLPRTFTYGLLVGYFLILFVILRLPFYVTRTGYTRCGSSCTFTGLCLPLRIPPRTFVPGSLPHTARTQFAAAVTLPLRYGLVACRSRFAVPHTGYGSTTFTTVAVWFHLHCRIAIAVHARFTRLHWFYGWLDSRLPTYAGSLQFVLTVTRTFHLDTRGFTHTFTFCVTRLHFGFYHTRWLLDFAPHRAFGYVCLRTRLYGYVHRVPHITYCPFTARFRFTLHTATTIRFTGYTVVRILLPFCWFILPVLHARLHHTTTHYRLPAFTDLRPVGLPTVTVTACSYAVTAVPAGYHTRSAVLLDTHARCYPV